MLQKQSRRGGKRLVNLGQGVPFVDNKSEPPSSNESPSGPSCFVLGAPKTVSIPTSLRGSLLSNNHKWYLGQIPSESILSESSTGVCVIGRRRCRCLWLANRRAHSRIRVRILHSSTNRGCGRCRGGRWRCRVIRRRGSVRSLRCCLTVASLRC